MLVCTGQPRDPPAQPERQLARPGPIPYTVPCVILLSSAPLPRTQRIVIYVACLLLVALLGLVDWATGSEISFSIFYLAPVAIASWLVGSRYTHPLIPVWNALMRGASS
jgi:hypothetical protein